MSGKWGSFDPSPDRRGMDELRKLIRHEKNRQRLKELREQAKREERAKRKGK